MDWDNITQTGARATGVEGTLRTVGASQAHPSRLGAGVKGLGPMHEGQRQNKRAVEYAGCRPERTLSNSERILLEWLLARPSSDVSRSDVSTYKSQVAKLRVVAKCGCGCPCVNFALGSVRKLGASEIVAEAGGKSPEGVFVGVILHARECTALSPA